MTVDNINGVRPTLIANNTQPKNTEETTAQQEVTSYRKAESEAAKLSKDFGLSADKAERDVKVAKLKEQYNAGTLANSYDSREVATALLKELISF